MRIISEFRRQTRAAIAPFLLVLAILYFGVSFVEGDRGFLAWMSLTQQNHEALADLEELRSERLVRERLVRGLKIDNLDLDLLDQQARRILGFSAQNDFILLSLADK